MRSSYPLLSHKLLALQLRSYKKFNQVYDHYNFLNSEIFQEEAELYCKSGILINILTFIFLPTAPQKIMVLSWLSMSSTG